MNARTLSGLVHEYAATRTVNVAPLWRARSYETTRGRPTTIRRAHALNEILISCDTPLWPGELLVGLGNPARKGAPGVVSEEDLRHAHAVCSEIGARTFQTHADHHAPDYPRLLERGFGGLREDARLSLAGKTTASQRQFLCSVLIALDGATAYMKRFADLLRAAAKANRGGEAPAGVTADPGILADRMARLSELPPSGFAGAVQLVFSYHSMMQLDERGAMAFGRVDQYLYPFYRADVDAGVLTRGNALRLLEHFFAKITVDEDVQNITLGGVQPNDGADATNELSYLILEACRTVGLPGGNCTARVHDGTPDAFLEACGSVIRSGIGYPALCNDEVQIPALMDAGIPLQTARDYCFVGCIEAFIPGRCAPWSDSRFNAAAVVRRALLNAAADGGAAAAHADGTGAAAALPSTPAHAGTWTQFYEHFQAALRRGIAGHVRELEAARRPVQAKASEYSSPLMSALVADCIERGRDVNDGGAFYPANVGTAIMGIGVAADSLAAVKRFVFDRRTFTLKQVADMLNADFVGYEAERQAMLADAPKYGNDDEEVDSLAADITSAAGRELLRYRTPQGGRHWGLMAANTQNISAGRETGATPDGRRAGEPLSDAASPTFGRDQKGPTAVIKSVAKLPYRYCPGGNVVNMKLHPDTLAGAAGLKRLVHLVRTCFGLGGVQLQFNTTDRAVLTAAMEDPAAYEHLVVRVSGFSAHFTRLGRAVQEDILARTEHRIQHD